MHYLIYKITNRLDNKFYVGKHKTENKDDGYFGSGVLIERAIAKHGKENFVKEILFELPTEEEMNRKEADIVDEDFVARDDTYNIMLGGNGGFSYINGLNLNHKHDTNFLIEMARKAGESTLNRRADAEYDAAYRLKVSLGLKRYYSTNKNPFLGRIHTPETKKKIGEANRARMCGESNPARGKQWITDGKVNKFVPKSEVIPVGFRRGRV